MNLHRILQISKGLPPDSLHDMLFARKLSARPTETVTVSGYPCVLENSAGKPVVDYRIYGNTVQDGTPMPDNPVEIQSVGDLVTEGEYAGKYKIPVVASTENNVPKTTNIYLDEPLRKIGDYADVIDFERGVVERKIRKVIFNGTETWLRDMELSDTVRYFSVINFPGRIEMRFDKCTHFERMDYPLINTIDAVGFSTANRVQVVFRVSKIDFPTTDSLKKFLNEQYTKGTPVTVYYALADPTTEPISLPSIPTFDGTTIIKTDTEIQPSNMEITYKARK